MSYNDYDERGPSINYQTTDRMAGGITGTAPGSPVKSVQTELIALVRVLGVTHSNLRAILGDGVKDQGNEMPDMSVDTALEVLHTIAGSILNDSGIIRSRVGRLV